MSLVNGNEQIRGESHAQLLMRLMKEPLLRDEQEHPLMEMKQTIMQQTGEEYSHGTWAGAVRRLTETWNGCRAVRRGVYQYLPPAVLQETEDTAAQLKREAAAVLRAQEQLTKLADRVNIVGGGGVGAENGSLPAGNLPASPGGKFPVRRAGMS